MEARIHQPAPVEPKNPQIFQAENANRTIHNTANAKIATSKTPTTIGNIADRNSMYDVTASAADSMKPRPVSTRCTKVAGICQMNNNMASNTVFGSCLAPSVGFRPCSVFCDEFRAPALPPPPVELPLKLPLDFPFPRESRPDVLWPVDFWDLPRELPSRFLDALSYSCMEISQLQSMCSFLSSCSAHSCAQLSVYMC